MTHTYAVLVVSPLTYQDVRKRLLEAAYDHAIHHDRVDGEVIDMHGIALSPELSRGITNQGTIHDWATRCAEYVDGEFETAKHRPTISRLAAVIAHFADPLVKLLSESKRLHLHVEGDPYLCCPLCTRCEGTRNSSWNGECHPDCGADEWNAKVEKALAY